MGSPKPLLAWQGRTLVEYQVCSLLDAGVRDVIVVLGHRASEVAPFIHGEHVVRVLNPDYEQGKTTSIKAGLKAVPSDADAIMLLAVDQPRTPEIIARVIAAHIASDALITSPRYKGHGGHPLIFDASLLGELLCITEENQGVREVFQGHLDRVAQVQIDDPMVRLDLNTPEAYAEALERYGSMMPDSACR
jgi:molybdenum cofactor cytidylyltransferase